MQETEIRCPYCDKLLYRDNGSLAYKLQVYCRRCRFEFDAVKTVTQPLKLSKTGG